jgi:hypothetical protein
VASSLQVEDLAIESEPPSLAVTIIRLAAE